MKIEKLFMDAVIKPCPETDLVIDRCGLVPEIVENQRVVFDHVNNCEDPVLRGKKDPLHHGESRGNH